MHRNTALVIWRKAFVDLNRFRERLSKSDEMNDVIHVNNPSNRAETSREKSMK